MASIAMCDGWYVMNHWPKFRPLAKRLGIPMDEKLHADGGEVIHRNVRAVEFKLVIGENVQVKVESYDGSSTDSKLAEDGYCVYHWPEFKEATLSFGFPYDKYVKWCSFRLAEGEQPTMTACMACSDEDGVQEPKTEGYKYKAML